MREIISYQATDGKLFNNKEDCIEYENRHYFYRVECSTMIKFLDDNRKELRNPASTDCYYEQKFEDIYNKAAYLIIESDLDKNTTIRLYEDLGIHIPYQHGEYRYNEGEGWVKITDDFIAFCKRWGLSVREMIERFTP